MSEIARLRAMLEERVAEGAALFARGAAPSETEPYLQRWEQLLFGLLYRKEGMLLDAERDPALLAPARELESVIDRFADYRGLVAARLPADFPRERLHANSTPERLIVLVTRRCQLRCVYCDIPDYSQDLSRENVLRAADFLLASSRPRVQLQFFGGEPLLKFDSIRAAVERVEETRGAKEVSYLLTTNGLLIDREKLDFFKRHRFYVEVSCDGAMETQLAYRKLGEVNYYEKLMQHLELVNSSGVEYHLVMTIMPERVPQLFENFRYLAERGHRRIQINYAVGVFWDAELVRAFLAQMDRILAYVSARPGVELINATELRREPVVLNGELTVDRDGSLFLEPGIFLNLREDMDVGTMEDGRSIDLKGVTPFESFLRMSRSYGKRRPEFRRVLLNNIQLGWIVDRWLRRWCRDAGRATAPCSSEALPLFS